MTKKDSNIVDVDFGEAISERYLSYALSTIMSRSLPDVRDGLKPVHRRVLYGMHELGVAHNKAYKKSARIVGEVLGKYHPHGDQAVYDSMVRMVQVFSLRYPLLNGQGNYGSIDGDRAAAMRYTEIRMHKLTDEILRDIKKDRVDFTPNFDESLGEPTVLPSNLPNLLINGSTGIAVGMATSIPPYLARYIAVINPLFPPPIMIASIRSIIAELFRCRIRLVQVTQNFAGGIRTRRTHDSASRVRG